MVDYIPSTQCIRNGAYDRSIHMGQRKLLLSEMEFIINYIYPPVCLQGSSQKNVLIVYAGAAPGIHIPQLVYLFPGIHWVLVDPLPFSSAVSTCTTKPKFYDRNTCKHTLLSSLRYLQPLLESVPGYKVNVEEHVSAVLPVLSVR